jgi:transmembrane sensor
MNRPRITIEDEAIGWVIRQRDPGFADWDSFMLWLEEDSMHAQVYDEMALADRDMASYAAPAPKPLAPPARHDGGYRPSRRGALGWGAVAASLVAFAGYSLLVPASAGYAVETKAGERQSVALADGSRIDLNGGTRLMLDRENPRFAQLERGEALFTVVHDETRPFIVKTGGATLTDAGTAFNVVRAGDVTEVAVSEGVVIYDRGAERVTLPIGRRLRAVDGRRAEAGDTDPGAVAAWREGRLIYGSAAFATVADDLSRNLGVPVSAAPGVRARRFSGVILLDGGADRAVPRAGAVLGVSARREGNGWVLMAGSDAER